MPNYNDAQGVADLLSQFDFNIISEGPGDFSTQHRKYTCEFSKPGIESFTTTYQSNPVELAFGCPAEEYEAPVIDPLLETAEFTSSAIMSAEVAPGAASATVHDVAGVPYEVPADVLNGLKDAVRISDRAATTTLFTSLTIAEWTQKGDESAKTSPVSLKAAAKEARESSAALAAHGASTIDLEHEADNAQKASETLFDADGDR